MLDPRTLYTDAERGRALPDFIRSQIAGAPPGNPIARDLLDEGISLRALVQSFDPKPDAPGDPFTRASGSSDLSAGLAQTISALALSAYDSMSEWAAIAWRVQVANFKPSSLAQLGLSALAVTPENSSILPLRWYGSTAALETVGVDAHSHRFAVTREVLLGDSVGMMQSLSMQVGQAVSRAVATALAAALESSDTLSDGRAWFNATDGNLAGSGAAPSAATLNAAIQALRAMTDPAGNVVGVPARYLVVPSALEATARILVASTFGPSEWLRVIVLPTLTSATAWYLVAAPEVQPSLAVLSLAAPNRPLFTIERAPKRVQTDAVEFTLYADFRVARASRFAYKNPGV